ncbi:MAG: hypothetical protein ACRD4L_10790, partial [Pyrinomonadaceae bacterium]
MQIRTIKLQIDESDIIHLHPISIHEENSQYLIGVKGTSAYVSTSEKGVMAVRLFSGGFSVGEIRRRMEMALGTSDFTLLPLLEKLLAAGMVQAVGDQQLQQGKSRHIGIPVNFNSHYISWLFSMPAIIGYILIVITAIGLLCLK